MECGWSVTCCVVVDEYRPFQFPGDENSCGGTSSPLLSHKHLGLCLREYRCAEYVGGQ
jgi:hypothetical protein